MDENLDSIIAKIQKLINLQEGAESVGSLAEAENAAARIQDLLMKHNLDLEKVKDTTIRNRAEFFNGWVELGDKQDKRESFWVPQLYRAIANNNLCKAYADNDSILILGRKEQVELVLYISEQMVAKVRIAEKYAWQEYEGEEKRGTFRRGFFMGASVGIGNRLHKENNSTDNPYAVMIISRQKELLTYEEYGTINPDKIALIIKQREQAERDRKEDAEKLKMALSKMSKEELRKWKKENKGPKTRYRYSRGPKQISSQDGYYKGKEAGEKMTINKGMENKQSKGNIS